ncbi:MAG: prepilin peptidase [Actinobacteria bacterium]|nr:prepilin peptidase [Actinomycetota bacterium]
MSRALTISLGALSGMGLGYFAKSLIKKIDSEIRRMSGKVLAFCFVAGAVIAEFVFLRFFETELRVCFAILCAGLLLQSLIDFYTHRLVRQISHALACSGVLLLSLNAAKNSNFDFLVSSSVCAILGIAVSFFSNKISRGSLGAGDVRLMAVLGWHLGFIGYSTAMLALFLACIFASVFGVAMIALGRGSWQQRIAFGPFLTIGSLVAIFADLVPSYGFFA